MGSFKTLFLLANSAISAYALPSFAFSRLAPRAFTASPYCPVTTTADCPWDQGIHTYFGNNLLSLNGGTASAAPEVKFCISQSCFGDDGVSPSNLKLSVSIRCDGYLVVTYPTLSATSVYNYQSGNV